jgi:hypothetical protein
MDKPFEAQRKADTSVYNLLERQGIFNSLDKSEKELLYWVNFMRKDPSSFNTNYILPFLDQFPEAKSQESRTLVKRMSALSAMPQLSLAPVLVGTAGDHANYLADKKTISHTGRGGKGFGARMLDAGVSGCAGENIFDGQDDALMVLILLLIDTGVPGAGHREALLNPQFTTTGIGVARMNERRVVFVQQFGCM